MAVETNDKVLKVGHIPAMKEELKGINDKLYLGKDAQAASAAKLGNTTAIGSATQPVYFDENGLPVAGTNTLGTSVPSDAVFTDTTYENATGTDAGLMSAADYTKLDGITAGAQPNVIEGITIGGTDVALNDKKAALGTAAGASTESTLTDGSNLPTGSAVKTYVEGLDYQTSEDVQSAISTALATVLNYKGVKAAKTDLPAAENKTGDVWHVTEDSSEYAWNGSEWEELGVTFDATGYVTTDQFVIADEQEVRAAFSAE